MTGDVLGHELFVAPFALLVPTDEPAAIGRVRFDHPQLRMILLDVVVGIHAPLLVRTADEIDPQFRQNIRRVVQRLREVLNTAPDQNMKWPRIVSPRAFDDPFGALGRLADTGASGVSSAPCLQMARNASGVGYLSEYDLRFG